MPLHVFTIFIDHCENVQWNRNQKTLAAAGRNQQIQVQVPGHCFNPYDNEENASGDGLSIVQTSRGGRIADNS